MLQSTVTKPPRFTLTVSVPAIIAWLATPVIVVTAAVLVTVLPPLTHQMIDGSQSAIWLGSTNAQAFGWSDATIWDLFTHSAFNEISPNGQLLYSPNEIAHLQDVRRLLDKLLVMAFLAAVLAVSMLITKNSAASAWKSVRRGATATIVMLVIVVVIALAATISPNGFNAAFTGFHEIFFSGGNYAFDPAHDHLVQLYPTAFWEKFAITLGAFTFTLALGARSLATRQLSRCK